MVVETILDDAFSSRNWGFDLALSGKKCHRFFGETNWKSKWNNFLSIRWSFFFFFPFPQAPFSVLIRPMCYEAYFLFLAHFWRLTHVFFSFSFSRRVFLVAVVGSFSVCGFRTIRSGSLCTMLYPTFLPLLYLGFWLFVSWKSLHLGSILRIVQ